MKKDNFFELIRGISILAVVLIHCIASINFNTLDINQFNYSLILRQIINFPVAIFVFMVGYFSSIKKIEINYKKYFKNRFVRLMIPFFIWSLIYSLINIALSSKNINILELIFMFFTGQAAAPLYYILVLIQLLLLTPLIIKIIKSNKKIINYLLLMITPFYLFLLYIYIFITKVQLQLYATIFMGWFVFYYLGLYIKIKGIEQLKIITIKNSIIFVAITLILSIIEAYFIKFTDLPINFALSQIKISSILYSIAVVNLIIQIKKKMLLKQNIDFKNFFSKIIIKLGNYSFGIYFIHCIFISVISKILNKYIDFNLIYLYPFLEMIIVVILSYISIKLTKKIFKNEISEKLLGF